MAAILAYLPSPPTVLPDQRSERHNRLCLEGGVNGLYGKGALVAGKESPYPCHAGPLLIDVPDYLRSAIYLYPREYLLLRGDP